MNSTNKKLSKIETRNLLRHASALSSTGIVADMIDVPATRISEGKRGDWQLTVENADKLRAKFGMPLAEAGLFLKCEVWDSLEAMQAESDAIARWRQWQRLMAIIRHSDFRSILGSLLGAEKSADVALIRDHIGTLLQDTELVSWYHNCKEMLAHEAHSSILQARGAPLSLSSSVLSDGDLKIMEIVGGHGLTPRLEWYTNHHWKHQLTLILLAELACNRLAISELSGHPEGTFRPFVDSWPAIDAPPEAHSQEVVVTGDIIWKERAWITPLKRFSSVLPLAGLPDLSSWLTSQEYDLQWLTGFLPDQFNHLELQVAMTKHLNYHLVLTLSLQRDGLHSRGQQSASLDDSIFVEWIPARQAIIRDVKSEELFDTIGQIYRWLGLPFPEILSLKREIANNGGYLSGALYLE